MSTKSFGYRLASLRSEKGLTGKQLGELVGANKSIVAQWESGRNYPNNEKLIKLADIFGVTIDYLMGRTDSKQSINVLTAKGEEVVDLSNFTQEQQDLIKSLIKQFQK